MNKQEYIESVNAAKQHSYEYYVLSRPTISDAEFDALVARIEDAEREHPEWTLPDSPTQCVGSDLSGNGKRLVRHRTPMLSCQKAQTTEAVEKWLEKVKKKMGGNVNVMLSWKADGISCSLVYQDGHLISAATRGDGMNGSDLLEHVKVMSSVPLEIPAKGRVEVRGEIVCPKKNLRIMVEHYADCRSAASGICGKNYVHSDCHLLEFWAWDLIAPGADFQLYIGDELHRLGFPHHCYREDDNGSHLTAMLEHCGELRDAMPIPVDGVVIRIDSNRIFDSFGFTDHHPKGSIAYKFAAQTTTTRVRRIEITVGATGRRTPVAWLEPVTVLGRTIEKASLGSEDKMQELGVTDGCTVEVGLSNDVTPKIYRVTEAAPAGYVAESAPVPSYIGPTISPSDVETTKGAAPVVAGQRLNVVISGCFTTSALDGYGRDAAKMLILAAGHKVQSSVGKSTNYLVIGTADVPGRGVGPSKLAQCKAMGIPVVTMEEFKALIAA